MSRKAAITIVLLGVGGAICRSQVKQKAGYVDPGLCAGCHRKIAEDYARTGMGRSFQSAQAVALPEFNGAAFYHKASNSISLLTEKTAGIIFAGIKPASTPQSPMFSTVKSITSSDREITLAAICTGPRPER